MNYYSTVLAPIRANQYGDTPFENWWYHYGQIVSIILGILISLLVLAIPYIAVRIARARDKDTATENLVSVNLYGFKTVSVSPKDVFFPDIPVKDGYSFTGWFYDPSFTKPFMPGKKLKKDLTLYPRWQRE